MLSFRALSIFHGYISNRSPKLHTPSRAQHESCMTVPRVRTNVRAKAMSVSGPKFWNPIKSEFRKIESLDAFKHAIYESATFMFENHPT